jgi:hypothetical protein
MAIARGTVQTVSDLASEVPALVLEGLPEAGPGRGAT